MKTMIRSILIVMLSCQTAQAGFLENLARGWLSGLDQTAATLSGAGPQWVANDQRRRELRSIEEATALYNQQYAAYTVWYNDWLKRAGAWNEKVTAFQYNLSNKQTGLFNNWLKYKNKESYDALMNALSLDQRQEHQAITEEFSTQSAELNDLMRESDRLNQFLMQITMARLQLPEIRVEPTNNQTLNNQTLQEINSNLNDINRELKWRW